MAETTVSETQVVNEVVEKVQHFISQTHQILADRDQALRMYKGTPIVQNYNRQGAEYEGLARTATSATAEAVETLCNTLYAMMMATDPNFEVVGLKGDMDPSLLFKITQLHRYQLDKIEYRRKLMIALRSLVLNGTVFVEEPWVSWPPASIAPLWEATDFIPRPFHQMFFSPTTINIDFADYIGTMDIVTPIRLRSLAAMDQEGSTWNKNNIEIAIADGHNEQFVSPEVKNRLMQMGYTDFKNNMELITYYGKLEALNDNQEFIVGILNRKHLVRFHANPNPYGMRPFRIAHHIETEIEPMGLGVFHQAKETQKWLNATRNRVIDTITFSLYNMMVYSRFSGLKTKDLRMRPWSLIAMDDVNGIQPLRPDIQAAVNGLKLEEYLVNELRNVTGATTTLQAVITEATASEVRIAQNNSIRRVSNEAEILANKLLREHLLFSHAQNTQFLDRPLWIKTSGVDNPTFIFPSDLRHEVDFYVKIVTDKDFAPSMIKNTLQLLQILTSVRNMIPDDVNIRPLVGELVRRLGVDPSTVFIPKPPQPIDQERLNVLSGLLSREQAMAQPPVGPLETTQAALQGVNELNGAGSLG